MVTAKLEAGRSEHREATWPGSSSTTKKRPKIGCFSQQRLFYDRHPKRPANIGEKCVFVPTRLEKKSR
jgi:hypothetical protein